MWKFNKKIITLTLLQGFLWANQSNYSLAIGEEDKDRLIIINEIYNPYTEALLSSGAVREGDHILEIGCGIGIVSQQLAKRVGPSGYVLATDINEPQLRTAASLLPKNAPNNLEFHQLDAYELSSLDEKFDVIYVRFLLSHLPDPTFVIRQMKALLKPEGRLIIEDLTGNDTLYSSPRAVGMEILQKLDELQFKMEQSDDHYFDKLPTLLKNEGFIILTTKKSHPELDTLRKRTVLTRGLSSLKEALLVENQITEKEYNDIYPLVQTLVEDSSIRIFCYELGQIVAIYSS